jgi:hypothetical protein
MAADSILIKMGSKVGLSINPEQTPGFRPGEVEGLIGNRWNL